jgi:hypothetical protein
MVDLILLPTAKTTRRHIDMKDMRMALRSIMIGHAEMEAHIKSFIHPRLTGKLLHIIKAIPVRPTTFHLITPTHNNLQDTTITSRLMTIKMERQRILGTPAKPHSTAPAMTPDGRLRKTTTTPTGMAKALFSIRRPREDGLARIYQKRGCVLGFRDLRARSSVLHTRTLAFSITNNNSMTIIPGSNLILDLGQ